MGALTIALSLQPKRTGWVFNPTFWVCGRTSCKRFPAPPIWGWGKTEQHQRLRMAEMFPVRHERGLSDWDFNPYQSLLTSWAQLEPDLALLLLQGQ